LASGVWPKFMRRATCLLVPFVIWMPTCTSDEQMASWPAVIYLPGLPTHT